MKSSCIQHPERERITILRQSYIDLCEGDRCAALLLSDFEYWHNVKLGQLEQEIIRSHADPDYGPELSLWIYKSTAELVSDLLGQYARDKILASIQLLLAKSYLQVKEDPRSAMSRIRFFLFIPETVNADLMLLPPTPSGGELKRDNRKTDSRRSKNQPSGKAAKSGRTTVDKGTLDGRISDFLPYTETTSSEITNPPPHPVDAGTKVEEDEDLQSLAAAVAAFVVASPDAVRAILKAARSADPSLSAADVAVAVPIAVPSGYQIRRWTWFVTALPETVVSARFLQELQRTRTSRAYEAEESARSRRQRIDQLEGILSRKAENRTDDDRWLLENVPADEVEEARQKMIPAAAA